MTAAKTVSITRIVSGQITMIDDVVVEETPLSITVNGVRLASIMCTPTAIEQLVVGYLLSSGIINSLSDVQGLQLDEATMKATVTLPGDTLLLDREKALSTGCGKGEIYLDVITHCQYNSEERDVAAEVISDLFSQFNKRSELFMSTGGVHSGALCNAEGIVLFHEDIGRHNAVDKLIGDAHLQKIPLTDKLLLTSGRLSSEILVKAARQSIPIIASRSAPTSLALELAERLNITLIGFARGNRMNVYTAPHRISVSP